MATGELLRFLVRYYRLHTFSSRAVAKVIDIPEPEPEPAEGDSEETSAPNGVTRADSIPPNLEEFIPGERLPDVIDVYVDGNFFVSWKTKVLVAVG